MNETGTAPINLTEVAPEVEVRKIDSAEGLDWYKVTISFVQRLAILIFYFFARTNVPYLLLRALNFRKTYIKSVFYCYPGNTRYVDHYSFVCMRSFIKWFPVPIGVYRQGRYWGVVFASTVTEQEFTNPKNRTRTATLIKRLQFIATLIGAENVQLAGILPSFLEKKIPELKLKTAPITPRAVIAAARVLENSFFQGRAMPIILLGGNGKIGRLLQEELSLNSTQLFIVDPNDGLSELPRELFGQRCLLIDVSRAKCLEKYVDQLWPEIMVLNETFPEPRKDVVRYIRNRGLKIFHLSGVEGQVYPSLPMGYSNSVPCCAMHDIGDSLRPVLKEL